MNIYNVSLAIIGLAALGMAWMPYLSQKTKVSYALFYVLIGVILYSLIGKHLPPADPIKYQDFTLHLTELVVIVSIMGTGLKIDQPFSFRTWRVPFRLVSITMLLCIGSIMLLGNLLLGFSLGSALLLGAVLAPTDPVLAADVQVEPPMQGEKENVRFSLTAEAGMNDGMAFPFTWLAIAISMAAVSKNLNITSWVAYDLFYRIIAGVAVGYALGRVLAFFVFYLPAKRSVNVINDGFVGVAATIMVYGLTELVHGYGFIAVFVTAITLRNYEIDHKFHKHLHHFTDQIERILVAVVLILFGGSLVSGILNSLTWPMVGVAVLFLFVVRPLSTLISFVGIKLHIKEKLAISFFGIRGIGSFFYLAFSLAQYSFTYSKEIWSLVSFVILLSIVVHGLSANVVMKHLNEKSFNPLKISPPGNR